MEYLSLQMSSTRGLVVLFQTQLGLGFELQVWTLVPEEGNGASSLDERTAISFDLQDLLSFYEIRHAAINVYASREQSRPSSIDVSSRN